MLHEYLRSAIEHIIAVAKAHGIGPELPSVPYTVRWMEPVAENRQEGRQDDRSEPEFFFLWKHLESEVKESPAFRALQQAARDFASNEGIFLPFHGSLIDFQGEMLVQRYFSRVASLSLDESVIRALCREYQEDMRSDTVSVHAVYQVEDFKAEGAFSLAEGFTFRSLNVGDIDAYGRTTLDPLGLIPKPFGQYLSRKDWICEIERRVPKKSMEGFNRLGEEVEDIAAALNLTVCGRVMFSLLQKEVKSPFLSVGSMGGGGLKIATSRIGDPVSLGPDDVERFRRNYAALGWIGSDDDRLAQLRLPLRRLRISSSRMHDEDHLVDCVIALENLLASDTEQMETTFRFRLRGAAILTQEFGSVQERIKLMGRLYKLRSETVHGGKDAHGGGKKSKFSTDELRKAAAEAEKVLRAVLLWFIERSGEPEKLRRTLSELDEAMVTGGQTWAYPASEQATRSLAVGNAFTDASPH